jgi:hypothetical protein
MNFKSLEEYMRSILVIVAFLSIQVLAEVFPVFDDLFENDSVPGNGKGVVNTDYQYKYLTGNIYKGKHRSDTGYFLNNFYQYITITELVGIGENIYIGAKLPYEVHSYRIRDNNRYACNKGFGKPTLNSKWNLINHQDSLRLGIKFGLVLPTDTSYQDVYIPSLLIATGTPFGPGRLMANAGYTFNDASYYVDSGDIITYNLSYQLRIDPVFCMPVDFLGKYIFKDKLNRMGSAPDYNTLDAALSLSCLPLGDHWGAQVGLIVPIVRPYYGDDFDFSPRSSIAYYF